MKRLIGILILLFAAISFIAAQSTARTALSTTLRKGVTYYEYACVAADTIGTDQDTLTFEVLTNKNGPVNVAARVEVTRTGSTDDYEMRLQGKLFANDSWASVKDYSAQTASLTLHMPNVIVDTSGYGTNAAPFYRYWRVLIGSDGTVTVSDKLTVNKFLIKIFERQ